MGNPRDPINVTHLIRRLERRRDDLKVQRQEMVLAHLRKHGEITTSQAHVLFGLASKRPNSITLSEMVDEGLIIRIKVGHYTLPKEAS